MDRIDLHTHSTASDGSMTPSELVRHAASCGLRAVALTDHDTTMGLSEAQQEANEAGIELVHGVELATWQGKTELHIVGLDINERDPQFQDAMTLMQQIREDRNNQMIARMQAAGVDITPEKLHAKEGTGVLPVPTLPVIYYPLVLSKASKKPLTAILVMANLSTFRVLRHHPKMPLSLSNRLAAFPFSPIRCSISLAKTPSRNMSG